MVATDSYRLAVKRTELEGAIGGELEANIPAKALRELGRLVGGGEVEEVAVSLLPNQAVFKAGAILLNTRLIDGQFPNFHSSCRSPTSTTSACPALVPRGRAPGQPAGARNAPLRLSFSQGS